MKRKSASGDSRVVYVVGAGLSAGLKFPTIHDLLPEMWDRLVRRGLSVGLTKVIRFHHPEFNPSLRKTFPDIEQLLSEMQANAQLFESSRPATGNFTSDDLEELRKTLLLELAAWFHELQASALRRPPKWLKKLVAKIREEQAQVISFNWDLVLDEQLFGDRLSKSSYAFGKSSDGPRLIKPHGSLNWFEKETGRHLKEEARFGLTDPGPKQIIAFKFYRSPKSTRRVYMPLIVPPVLAKEFRGDIFRHLWQETVAALSTAAEVRFLGYSLAEADVHARFILRCGFHNQESGALQIDGSRADPTGRAKVTIIDPGTDGPMRITKAVGWECEHRKETIADWIRSMTKH
jgi:hypothetical protein